MADYPYVQSSDRLKKFFSHIREAGVPDKVTQEYLLQVGFKSKNDRPIINIIKFVGLCDSSGVPTEMWRQYRDKSKSGIVLARGIREGYSNLYKLYPEAHQQSDENITNFFSANTAVGQAALKHIVKTFRTLCDLAEFSSNGTVGSPSSHSSARSSDAGESHLASGSKKIGGASVVINIKLEVPATDDPQIYEAFFSSMKKHLLTD